MLLWLFFCSIQSGSQELAGLIFECHSAFLLTLLFPARILSEERLLGPDLLLEHW